MTEKARPSGAWEEVAVWAGRAVLIAAMIGLWSLAAAQQWVSRLALPTPAAVARNFPDVVTDSVTWNAIGTTAQELAYSVLLAVVGGLAVGGVGGLVLRVRELLEPGLVWLQVVPIILLYPVCVLTLGLGLSSKVAFASFYGFLPIAYATTRALAYVEPGYLKTCDALGGGLWRKFWRVALPAARVEIFAGIRIGVGLTLIGIFAGEILGSFGGLGYQITLAAQSLEPARLFDLVIVSLLLIGVVQGTVTLIASVLDRPRAR